MKRRWTREEAWHWYNSRPYLMGFNLVVGSVKNDIEMWQDLTFEESMAKTDKELEFAADNGFNCFRIFLSFRMWKHLREDYMQKFDKFLDIAAKHGMGVMPVLFNDCRGPEPLEYKQEVPKFGPQPDPDWGWHGGRKPSDAPNKGGAGWWDGDLPEVWPIYEEYTLDMIGRHANDDRILLWCLWNEPGNCGRETRSLRQMERAFELARSCDPIQPLCADAWLFDGEFLDMKNPLALQSVELRALELSDLVTYHYYGNFENMKFITETLKKFERPMMNNEWLHRVWYNNVEDILPYFVKNNVASVHWGLVNGYGQFHEPWSWILNDKGIALDKWQHDIFTKDFIPYDQKEIDIFHKYAPRTVNREKIREKYGW